MKTIITQDLVKELFDYKDGKLYWKVRKANRTKIGDEAGCTEVQGYRVIKINDKLYKTHILIWLWYFGELPPNQIDHINQVRDDNRIENLRSVTQQQNLRNKSFQQNNTTGYNGVYKDKRWGKWEARVFHDKRGIHLAYFRDIEDAAMMAMSARLQMGYHPNHGN